MISSHGPDLDSGASTACLISTAAGDIGSDVGGVSTAGAAVAVGGAGVWLGDGSAGTFVAVGRSIGRDVLGDGGTAEGAAVVGWQAASEDRAKQIANRIVILLMLARELPIFWRTSISANCTIKG